ncbi:MAG: glycosyltransferase family 2 protein [Chitinophagaceae bacterium]|nr:glycosyltransferase family 2 protein [Chitinophagaceae bacterium]
MNKLSVVIITYNEERNIGRCIDSVKNIADEVVVLDSMSTDNTVEIAKQKHARVFSHPFEGHIEQKNKVLSLATHSFVLSLDADEAIDPTLEASILKAKESDPYASYNMNRCTWYGGRFIRHGSWYPDRKVRLFNREVAYWGGENPHDRIEFKTPQKSRHLKGDIIHYPYYRFNEHHKKLESYTSQTALIYYKKNRKAPAYKIILSPWVAFMKSYVLKLGFLDGIQGFTIAFMNAYASFSRYAKLRDMYTYEDPNTSKP